MGVSSRGRDRTTSVFIGVCVYRRFVDELCWSVPACLLVASVGGAWCSGLRSHRSCYRCFPPLSKSRHEIYAAGCVVYVEVDELAYLVVSSRHAHGAPRARRSTCRCSDHPPVCKPSRPYVLALLACLVAVLRSSSRSRSCSRSPLLGNDRPLCDRPQDPQPARGGDQHPDLGTDLASAPENGRQLPRSLPSANIPGLSPLFYYRVRLYVYVYVCACVCVLH